MSSKFRVPSYENAEFRMQNYELIWGQMTDVGGRMTLDDDQRQKAEDNRLKTID